MNTKDPKHSAFLCKMDRTEFRDTDWHKGDIVMLTNGKTYRVESYDRKKLQFSLYSKEYKKKFRADCNITHRRVAVAQKQQKFNTKRRKQYA